MTDRHAAQGIPSPLEAHSIPLDNPLHGPPPARFRDGEVLVIEYRSDPEAIATLVPEPLVPVGDTVLVQVARWGDVPGLGRDTHEVNVMVGARYDRSGDPAGSVTGSYSPYFFVDSDRAMAGGREFHGQPKRMAEVGLEVRGDLIVGTLRRNGIDVFIGTLPYKSRPASIDQVRARVDFVTNINLKVIPQIDGRPGIRQLTARDLTDIQLAECWSGAGTARVEPNAQASLYRLPVLEQLGGYYWRGEFSLVGGIVLHEYAEERLVADERVLAAIGGPGVVAIFRTPSRDGVLEACTALRDNGIQAVEITMTIPGALGLIETVADALGADLAVGAGTVLDADTCRATIDAGASFVVLPGFDAAVVAECARAGVMSVPGCLTPTEVLTAIRAGADLIKLFPARVASPAYLADLLGPFPGTRLIPTGGIDELGAGEYARRGAFAVGVGGRLVEPRALRERDLAAIGAAARQLVASVAAGRAGA